MSCSNCQIKSPTWTSRVRLEEKNLKVPQLFPPLSSQGISVWMYCTCHFCYLTENFSGGMAGWRILCVTLYLRSLKYLVFSFPTVTHFLGQIRELVFLCRGQGRANPLLLVLCGSDKVISVLLRMECSTGFPVFKRRHWSNTTSLTEWVKHISKVLCCCWLWSSYLVSGCALLYVV